jgi:hypothetical protein
MIKNIIWLTGMPRSGTTWLSQIFASHPDIRVKFCPLFSYSFKNALDETATGDEWQELFSKVFVTEDEYMDQQHLRKQGLVPEFIKNKNPNVLLIKSNRFHHLTEGILQKCANVRFVSIIRHPCAAIHSWLSNPLEFPDGQDPKKQWRSGSCRKTSAGEFWGFEDWKKVASLHLRLTQKWPNRFFMERHENLLKAPLEKSRALFDKLGLEMPEATTDFIVASQSRHDTHRRSVYKDPSRLTNWRTGLNKDIANQIYQELKDTELAVFLED